MIKRYLPVSGRYRSLLMYLYFHHLFPFKLEEYPYPLSCCSATNFHFAVRLTALSATVLTEETETAGKYNPNNAERKDTMWLL